MNVPTSGRSARRRTRPGRGRRRADLPGRGRHGVLAARAGLPGLTGAGRFVAAHTVDSLGTGLVFAFTVVYLTHATHLSLAEIGAALTLGNLLALPAPALGGPLLDRFGPKAVVAVANLVSAAGFAAFLAVRSAWQISLAHLVVQAGINLYWTAARSLVPLACVPGEERLWFGFVSSLRNLGIGAGAAVSATALALFGPSSLYVLVAANAGTFLCAAALFTTWKPARDPGAPTPPDAPGHPGDGGGPVRRGSWQAVLRDGRYLLLIAANLAFVLAQMVPPVLLAVYVTGTLHAGAWIPGTLLVVNTAAVAVLTPAITRRSARHRPQRAIAGGFVVGAASFALFAVPLATRGAPGWAVATVLVVAMLLFTLSEILSSPALNELSVACAPVEGNGRHQAAFQLSWSLGGAAAPVVLTALLSRQPVLPWLLLALLSVLAVPAAHALVPPDREEPLP
ncbi:MFS transporter [Streptomyces durhamensis]|uniref:MFS transporter n=1 Tax=Streptomyces durhamensis TaxID=68194 RepID=UPI00068BC7FF|nr:MFS transporter [Streptomyces durhamensis]